MSGQTSYNYTMPKGIAGSLFDISPKAIDSRINGETDVGVMMYGMGAMQGDNPGINVIVPTAAMTAEEFEGVIMTGFTNEMDMSGKLNLRPLETVGVLRWGRAWVRVADGVTPAYGDDLYILTAAGPERGYFTNDAGGSANLSVYGRFIGTLGTGNVAPVEIYNQKPQ
jgi:hypothetical protein